MIKFYLLLMVFFSASIASANFYYPSSTYYSCSDYQYLNTDKFCSSEFSGLLEGVCEVCREGNSCFKALNNKKQRGLCQAYVEGRNCLMALSDSDQNWCKVINENKPCSILRSDVDRFKCVPGEFPADHNFWRL